MYMYMCLCMCGDMPLIHMCPRNQKRALDPWELELQGAVGCLMWVLIKDPLEDQQCSLPWSDLPSPKEKTF